MKDILLSDLLTRSVSRDSNLPLQRQIYEVVRRAVLDHTLVAGQKLPSSRALALELSLSRITVSQAYDRLVAESYLYSASGSGTFVATTSGKPRHGGHPSNSQGKGLALSQRGSEVGRGRHGLVEHMGAFVPGVADASMFPFPVWNRLVSRYLTKSQLPLAGYPRDGAGFLPLREAIASYLRISRSVECSADQVILTAGTHQSIDLCARMLTDPGDAVLVEDPCHWAFQSVLAAAGLNVSGVRLDGAGADLARTCMPPRARLVATSPSHQYPTGVVMPLARRLELLELASSRGLWVIEDDYDSEFRYDGAPLPSLQGLDNEGRVIYMGTFSKAAFPGIRMAYMVVPQLIAVDFSRACAAVYRSGMLHQQAAMADFISEGHFSQHIRRMRIVYGERQALLRELLHCEFGERVQLSPARAGLHLYVHLPPEVQTDTLIEKALGQGLVIGAPCGIDEPVQGVVLGFGGVRTEDISAGVRRLSVAFEQAGG